MTRCIVTTATCAFQPPPRSHRNFTPFHVQSQRRRGHAPGKLTGRTTGRRCVARESVLEGGGEPPAELAPGACIDVGWETVLAAAALVEDPVALVDSCSSRAQLVEAVVVVAVL